MGLVLGTNSDAASGIEISDLTIDGNYPELKSRSRQHGVRALTLDAIHLRSDLGGHWIHDVNVVNAAAEIGEIDGRSEAFPVQIASVQLSKPEQNRGNMIENVDHEHSTLAAFALPLRWRMPRRSQEQSGGWLSDWLRRMAPA